MQATIDLHESLRWGPRTPPGLQATIAAISDDNVDRDRPGVVTTWMKLAIRDRIEDVRDRRRRADPR